MHRCRRDLLEVEWKEICLELARYIIMCNCYTQGIGTSNGFPNFSTYRRLFVTNLILRWEFINGNKKVRKQERNKKRKKTRTGQQSDQEKKKDSFFLGQILVFFLFSCFLVHFLGWVLVFFLFFLFSWSLITTYNKP